MKNHKGPIDSIDPAAEESLERSNCHLDVQSKGQSMGRNFRAGELQDPSSKMMVGQIPTWLPLKQKNLIGLLESAFRASCQKLLGKDGTRSPFSFLAAKCQRTRWLLFSDWRKIKPVKCLGWRAPVDGDIVLLFHYSGRQWPNDMLHEDERDALSHGKTTPCKKRSSAFS